MKYLLIEICALCLLSCNSTKPVLDHPLLPTDNDFQSVLYLNDHAGHVATGFLYLRNDREYIVTAKHFANYMTGNDSIGIFFDGRWNLVSTQLVGHGKDNVDITVFTLGAGASGTQMTFDQTQSLSSADTLFNGCDLWYLGFPLKLMNNKPDRRYPYPLIKHAYLSTQNDNPVLYYCDGLCNPGFSGSPVYGLTTHGNLRLIGVVSLRIEENDGADTKTNSGIFTAYSIHYADSIIDANPIGTSLK